MFNLNFNIFNNVVFLTSVIYLVIVFIPIYDLASISESGVYFLYFILGYLIYYIITILNLFDFDLYSGKNSLYAEFLKHFFVDKIKIFKNIQNFYIKHFKFSIFFINIFLSSFFLVFFKKHLRSSDFYFGDFFIFSDTFIFENFSIFEKVFSAK
jgi:hypothetical protein